jgi:hypothetical protein
MKRRRRSYVPVPSTPPDPTEFEVIMLGADLGVLRRNNITVPGGYITRAQLPARVSDLVAAEGAPTAVVIIEPDGTRHADILHPPTGGIDTSFDTDVPGDPLLHGGGFLPGEEVQLLRLVSATRADADGHASADADHHGEVSLLYGAISGTVVRDPGSI